MKAALTFITLCLAMLAPAAPPNILLIVADDMGYADLGVTGAQDIPTPHLDTLAASGVRFTDAYVTAPYCAPSRAGLLTGRAGTRFGFEFNTGKTARPDVKVGLAAGETTLAEHLKSSGYRTGAVGKWHLGGGEGMHPLDQGFDEYFGILGGGSAYFGKNGKALRVTRGRDSVEERDYLTDAFGREAVEFIARPDPQPWFLYLAFNAVHDPMQPKEADLPRVPDANGKLRKPYAAMLVAMDDAIGRVMTQLRQIGADQNTLVVFLSDNGGPTAPINSNVNGSTNTPYRGGKRQLSEGGIRVPLLVAGPGIAAGRILDTPLNALDLVPTLLDAAGVLAPRRGDLEGLSLLPLLRGIVPSLPERELCWRFGNQYAIRRGDWKLVRWKHDDGKGFTEGLFNLRDDPAESHDISARDPDLVKSLAAAWRQWNRHNMDPIRNSRKHASCPARN